MAGWEGPHRTYSACNFVAVLVQLVKRVVAGLDQIHPHAVCMADELSQPDLSRWALPGPHPHQSCP